MRPRSLILPLLLLIVLSIITYHIYLFITTIFYTHSGPSFTQEEILQKYQSQNFTPQGSKEYIPRIIHHVFHNWQEPGNDTLPSDWEEVRRGCIAVHEDEGWEFKLWTESSSRSFIEDNYSWFLNTYDGYHFPIQRIDTVRYFLLRHYGGIYLDLDNGCKTSLTPLLQYPTFLTDGGRGALSNNILGSSSSHPFWIMVTESLVKYNYNFMFPYVTISLGSGQWFITAVWEKYFLHLTKKKNESSRHESSRNDFGRNGSGGKEGAVRIMMDTRTQNLPGQGKWVFFTQERGGTWEGWDNRVFGWVGDNFVWLIFGVLVLVGGVWIFGCRGGRGRYRRVRGDEEGEGKGDV